MPRPPWPGSWRSTACRRWPARGVRPASGRSPRGRNCPRAATAADRRPGRCPACCAVREADLIQERALSRGQLGFELGQDSQGAAELSQVAGAGTAGGDPRDQPLHIVGPAQLFGDRLGQLGLGNEFGHRFQATFDLRPIDQRIGEPIGQQPRSHRRDGLIEHGQQAAAAFAIA